VLVVSAASIGLLRSALGGDADRVAFADMADVGANPARIIPAWRDFVDALDGGGRTARGIGVPAWWLLCPYDTSALGGQVLEEARRSHPFVSQRGVAMASGDYRGLDGAARPFAAPLPDPTGRPPELRFGPQSLGRLRALVARYGAVAGLGKARTADLVLAVDEVATNSLRHGGGRGTLRIWREDGAVVCEVCDDGGRGLWMVNQLCDLVQLRTFPTGAVVRLHLYVR
jgi:hypothetical protein